MTETKSIALALMFAALVAAAPSAQARGKDNPPQPPSCIPSQIGAADRSPDALLTSRSRVPMWAREPWRRGSTRSPSGSTGSRPFCPGRVRADSR